MDLRGKQKRTELPHVNTPDSLTNQNMWAFFFTEIQRIHTEELNPLRLRVNAFDSTALLPYRSVLRTLTQMFAGFLYKDFLDEKKKIDKLFSNFQVNYNKAKNLEAGTPIKKFVQGEVNDLYTKCLEDLELIDNYLEVIRQKKGFGVTEQVSFVINERASKALRINDNIGKDILKIFKRSKEKKKVDKGLEEIDKKVEEALNE